MQDLRPPSTPGVVTLQRRADLGTDLCAPKLSLAWFSH